ncbi:2-oxo acid dehydrogenase subunit E2 [Glaciibacter psychrotolerans]|nr:dihydrolipoamide acetyltransferase family protein [Leifsonia psychrotolerans]
MHATSATPPPAPNDALRNDFLLPDLGEGLTEAEVVAWRVAPGDVIAIDQIVVEVESAKSVVELPSPYGGRVVTLHAALGQVVHAGMPLITVVPAEAGSAAAGGIVGGGIAGATDAGRADDRLPDTGLAVNVGSGAVLVGYGTMESTVRLTRPAGGRFGNRGLGTGTDSAEVPAPPPAAGALLLEETRRSPVVSPLVRKLAKNHGFEASQLLGSGTGFLVLKADVDAAIAARAAEPTNGDAPAGPAASVGGMPVASTSGATDLRIPLTGLRKVVAARLSQSRREIPEATIWLDVDATELFVAKDRLAKATGERFSITALIARFVVAGLQQYPILNSSLSADGQEIIQHGGINLGLAAQTRRGLMVPVVHNAHTFTTRELRDAIATLVATSERGDFPPADLTGGTFTLNNYGGFGVDGSAAIINYPEVAMLGIGRIIERPWVVDGALAVRRVVQLSFVFDHRVCDGDVASGFLTYVARCIEEPLLLLGTV